MLGGKAALGEGGAHLVLGKAGELLPDLLNAGGLYGLIHFLLKVSDA